MTSTRPRGGNAPAQAARAKARQTFSAVTGFRIDLDLRDMAAVRDGVVVDRGDFRFAANSMMSTPRSVPTMENRPS